MRSLDSMLGLLLTFVILAVGIASIGVATVTTYNALARAELHEGLSVRV